MNFKSHKLPGIDKGVCCAEQVIAYNYLFSWTLNDHDKNKALDHIHCITLYTRKNQGVMIMTLFIITFCNHGIDILSITNRFLATMQNLQRLFIRTITRQHKRRLLYD